MPFERLNRFKRPPINRWPFQTSLYFPAGLHGFESYQRFKLVGHQREIPFLWLEAEESEAISFLVIDPFPICQTYDPLIAITDLRSLKIEEKGELILLAIVNPKEQPHTMNLAAPLLVNLNERIGKQILIPGDPVYPIPSTSF